MAFSQFFTTIGALLLASGCAQILGIDKTKLDPDYGKDSDDDSDDDPADDAMEDDTADDDTVDGGGSGEDDSDGPDAGPNEPDGSDPSPMADAGPPEPGTDFSCVGTNWLERSEDAELEIVATIIDIAQGTPVAGIKLTECKTRLDLACTGVQVESDENGVARVPVRRGFDGYLQVEGPDADGNERVGYLWYFSQPLYNTYAFPILAMTREFRDGFFYSDVPRDPMRGEIAIQVTDCTESTGNSEIGTEMIANAPGVSAAGITLAIPTESFIDEMSREFYFSDNFPVSPPTATSTDGSGLGGFLNVKAGRVPIQARVAASERIVGRDTLLVRADFLTTVRLLPDAK
jgi:hypothetical protein